MLKNFNSLQDFEEAFPDEKSAVDHFRAIRWPDGLSCVHCGSMERVYTLSDGTHKCGDCRKKFTVRNGSIFEDSKLALRLWFKAIFLMTSHKKGISSHQLARDLGITQKSAWFVLHRIREASTTKEFQEPLTGTIETDEAYVGGQGKWKHASKKRPGMGRQRKGQYRGEKHVVLGMQQRDGDLRFVHLRQEKNFGGIKAAIRANILEGSRVHTDEAAHYKWMAQNFAHEVVTHGSGEYVRGDVTTNRIELAFGHFKRAVHGVYHKVSDEHLDRYLQMFTYRWNRRGMGEGERVNDLLKRTQGSRINYKRLTRKEK
jgi:transposase-like protein